MALSSNLSSIRGIHVSPGVYTQETVLEYAVKSLGITTLGAAGETVKGPAFQPMHVEDWNQFKTLFGGTDPSKFKGSQYPKYELPYIAKSYLSESKQMEVVRVLGLSGYNAGPAWLLTATLQSNNKKLPIAIIRSRGYYKEYPSSNVDDCECQRNEYDKLTYYAGDGDFDSASCSTRQWIAGDVFLSDYYNVDGDTTCGNLDVTSGRASYDVSSLNYGKFTINVHAASAADHEAYPVSLNPFDRDYILKVLGNTPDDGDALVYVESLFDVALVNAINNKEITAIDSNLTFFEPKNANEMVTIAPATDLRVLAEGELTRANLYKRYLETNGGTTYHDENNNTATTVVGTIYVVQSITTESGKKYVYKDSGDKLVENETAVQVLSDNRYYIKSGSDVIAVTVDLNDYKSAYRYASTPWIVSNLLGDKDNIHVERMFRFHTISDGDNSNKEVKVSIENIRPDEGLFDVVVHDINDSDEYPIVLEKFTKCSMTPGANNIQFKIGSFDGTYESKSKYITVETNDTLGAKTSVPAGFLGYPSINFKGTDWHGRSYSSITQVPITYNTHFDSDIKNKKQYFGLSSWVGIDIDMFTFKGNAAYYDSQDYMTPGFHLDSRLISLDPDSTGIATVEGGWKFAYVAADNVSGELSKMPKIDTEENMLGCIYEYVNLRKFMVYFAGGFDGWDIYRDERTISDKFKANKYKGMIGTKSGKGYNFDKIEDPEVLGLNEKGITSDYYAYLAAARQFANPEAVDCNVIVTPGIDLINDKELSEEIIDMVETERADSIYVATLPDKPIGAGDYADEMYTSEDIVGLLEDTDIDSNYTCTYWPWVKYYDQDNSQYIYLPATKDVVRNMAMTDNTSFPWFAPAGMQRGDVNCVRAHMVTKIADEDALYEGRINPIKTFAQDGVKIWGQKTLQVADNQLNRIATRRLMLRMRKLLAIGCRQLIFDPNDPTVKQEFLSIVTPIMDNIRSNRGISDYRIEVLDTVESRQRYELPARIYFKAYNQLEYILLDLVLTPEGISFSDI